MNKRGLYLVGDIIEDGIEHIGYLFYDIESESFIEYTMQDVLEAHKKGIKLCAHLNTSTWNVESDNAVGCTLPRYSRGGEMFNDDYKKWLILDEVSGGDAEDTRYMIIGHQVFLGVCVMVVTAKKLSELLVYGKTLLNADINVDENSNVQVINYQSLGDKIQAPVDDLVRVQRVSKELTNWKSL